jgi:two-component SAPR family response regulator
MHFFFWPHSVISLLCKTAMDKDIEVAYVRRLIKLHNLRSDPATLTTDKWPYPVKIYTLGRFDVLKDDIPIRFEGKVQRAPMNLLKMIIAFGGQDVSEQRLANALWPDSEGDAAQQSLATSLCRLRKLIGNDAIKRQEGRLSLDPQLCWVDCWMFERVLSDTGADIIESCRFIAEVYHSPFLESEDDLPWAVPMRERLHAKFIQCFTRCGKELQRLDRHEEAINFYQRGLEIDDLVEGFYRGLMISYAAIGQKAESIRIYERARKVFRAKLGVELSIETQRLLLSLSC